MSHVLLPPNLNCLSILLLLEKFVSSGCCYGINNSKQSVKKFFDAKTTENSSVRKREKSYLIEYANCNK